MPFWVIPRNVVRRAAAVCAALLVIGCAAAVGWRPVMDAAAGLRAIPIYRVAVGETPVIAITVNAADGEDDMAGILDVLERHDVRITFFLVGSWAKRYPEWVKALSQRGHDVQNHSMKHLHMNKLDEAGVRAEIENCSDLIETLTGKRPTLFRAPYGEYNDRVVRVARGIGYEAIQWDVDSQDWKGRGIGDMVPRVTSRMKNGSIVLFHNNTKDIVATLDAVLTYAQQKGYRIVTVPELLLPGETRIDHVGEQQYIAQ